MVCVFVCCVDEVLFCNHVSVSGGLFLYFCCPFSFLFLVCFFISVGGVRMCVKLCMCVRVLMCVCE